MHETLKVALRVDDARRVALRLVHDGEKMPAPDRVMFGVAVLVQYTGPVYNRSSRGQVSGEVTK